MFCIVLIVALCSYFVPAGEYARIQVDGRTVVDPNSYTRVESNPIGVMEFLLAFPTGMTAAASITFFIMIVSASFNIITETGAIKSAIGRAAVAFRSKENLMIPAVLAIFSIGGATFGMSEENVVFVPITIALARA